MIWQPPKTLKAVDGVTLRLFESETLVVVSQLSPVPLSVGLVKATNGSITWLGKELLGMKDPNWWEKPAATFR